jgi:hypothetical protein
MLAQRDEFMSVSLPQPQPYADSTEELRGDREVVRLASSKSCAEIWATISDLHPHVRT